MIKSLLVFFVSALAATATVPQEWVGQWLMVNGVLALQIDADGKVTLRNTGQHDMADLQADKTFRFALGGKIQVARIEGDVLWLKNENPEAPSWLAQLEFRRATAEQALELLKHVAKSQGGPLRAFSDVRRQSLEKMMQNDARQLAAASQQILLETGTTSVSFTVDPATGKVSGPLSDYVKAIGKGTSAVDGTYEVGGSFSLQNPDVYGGKAVSFDENGRKLP